jgi:hypothetical protein
MPVKDSKKLNDCIKKCEKSEKNETNLKIKNTKNDGNCFFSAIFRSLKAKNLLNDFYKCVNMIKSRTEVSFIKNIRKLIAENGTDDIKNMFDNLIIISQDKKTFKLVVDSLGDMNEVLYEYYDENKYRNEYENEFIRDIKKSIQKNGNWVGQLEVDITINLFNNCEFEENNLYIRVFNNYQTAKKEIKKEIKENIFDRTIYLLNQSESHYVYI